MRFNPPPNWPTPPPGWTPPPDWQPDPAWGPLPQGWPLWVDGAAPKSRTGRYLALGIGGLVLVGAVVAGVVLLSRGDAKSEEEKVADAVYALADAYNKADASAFNDAVCEENRFEQTDDDIREDIENNGEVTIESVEKVEVDGDTATADVTSREANDSESDTVTFEFKRIEGEWLVCNS